MVHVLAESRRGLVAIPFVTAFVTTQSQMAADHNYAYFKASDDDRGPVRNRTGISIPIRVRWIVEESG